MFGRGLCVGQGFCRDGVEKGTVGFYCFFGMVVWLKHKVQHRRDMGLIVIKK